MKKIINCPLVKRALALGLMLYGLGAYGATYHVAPTGDDATADGTDPETPYATLKAALGVAQKGDKIKIAGTIALKPLGIHSIASLKVMTRLAIK